MILENCENMYKKEGEINGKFICIPEVLILSMYHKKIVHVFETPVQQPATEVAEWLAEE